MGNPPKAIRWNEVLWASGSLATGCVYNAMALFSLFFMTSVLGIPGGVAGGIIFVTKIYDAITDPIMGAISDGTRHRWGPRRSYLLLGAVLLGLSFAAFFNLPALSGSTLIVAAVATLVLYSTSYTIFAVPYLAMPPTLSPSYDARTRLMSVRLFFLVVGVMLGSTLGPQIVQWGGEGARGYRALGWTLGTIATLGGLVAFFGTRGTYDHGSAATTAPRRLQLNQTLASVVDVFRYAPFRLLTIVKLLQLAVLALALACTPYFFRYVLERSTGDITAYLFTFSIAGLLSLPAWRWIVGRFGKRNVYIVSLVGYAFAMASWYLWQPGESDAYFYARACVIALFSNGTLLCALSLLPDTMEYDQLASGKDRQGIISGVFTTVEKIAGAIGPLVVGVLLQTVGLVEGRGPDVVQPATALMGVKIGMSLIPALFCLAAIPFVVRYKLGPAELEAARAARAHAT